MRKARSAYVALAIVLAMAAFVAACGGDDDDSGSGSGSGSGPAPAAPEDRRASDAVVAAGLAALKASFTQTADAVEAKAQMASTLQKTFEPQWAKIEGTIKANDPDAYITFEDQLAVMGDAVKAEDAAKAKQAAETFASTADKYLSEHPG